MLYIYYIYIYIYLYNILFQKKHISIPSIPSMPHPQASKRMPARHKLAAKKAAARQTVVFSQALRHELKVNRPCHHNHHIPYHPSNSPNFGGPKMIRSL
jgi:hypothetical protein